MNNNFGRIPPQSVDLEEMVLGTLLSYTEAFDEVSSMLQPNTFYKAIHQIIYEAIVDNARDNKPTDLWSIQEKLKQKNQLDDIGGPLYLVKLTEKVVTDKLLPHHASIIREKFIRREVIRISSESLNMAFDDDASEVVNHLENALFELTGANIDHEPITLAEAYAEYVEYLEKLENREIKLTGVPSGFISLDRMTLGFQPSDLIILAARPSVGKTALALQITRTVARMGKKVLLFSLEMSKRQVTNRLLSGDAEIDSQSLRQAIDLPWARIEDIIGKDYNKNIFIDDKAGQSVFEIRSTIRKYKRKHDIDLVIVDYLQLAKGDERFIKFLPKYYGSIGTTLKNTAKDVDIPIILLSQLNRSVEERSSHKPRLSDLKESGDIEQDADIILFPLRYENFKELHNDPEFGDISDKGHVDVAKNRNGPTGLIYISISKDKSRWEEWDKNLPSNIF